MVASGALSMGRKLFMGRKLGFMGRKLGMISIRVQHVISVDETGSVLAEDFL